MRAPRRLLQAQIMSRNRCVYFEKQLGLSSGLISGDAYLEIRQLSEPECKPDLNIPFFQVVDSVLDSDQ